MSNTQTPIPVDASELSSTPQQITMSASEFNSTAAPKSNPSNGDTITMTPAEFTGTPVDASELQSEQEFKAGQPSQSAQTPQTTPLRDKPIPAQPAPSRQRQEFLRRTGGGSTTEKASGEANETAAVTGAGLVASEGTDAVLGKLLGPTVKLASKGTGILDEAGNEIMREVETKGPSLARQGITKAAEAIKPAVDFAKAHPVASTISASVLEGLAHELGIDPWELSKKLVKFGAHVVGE
jgi:hypothetical protein